MKIGYFQHEQSQFLGAVFEKRVIDLTRVPWSGSHPFLQRITDLLRTENFSVQLFQSLLDAGKDREELWHDIESLTFLPLFRPGKIVCLGLNYVEHAKEGGREAPAEPIYFEKAVTAMIAHGQPVIYPRNLGRIDPEPELAVVIGKRAEKVSEAAARECIAGYTILNDVTARDMQGKDVSDRQPWYRSKSIDTFCPVGPWIVTSDEIDPLKPLKIELRVNGLKRLEGTTADLIFKIPTLIATISSLITLEAGDIISTGTPAGIAPIYPNDIMEIEIEGIGVLRNPVQAAV
jgi:5-oxopent-3-ene-1,2,5-tricarboxylate decarboxylase / 2-hydroxyhepta-2,4-diene-1,7-dioate isomerase